MTEEKPKVVTAQSGPQIDTRKHTMVTRACSAYLAANSTLKNSHGSLPGPVSKKFRISRKNLAERNKQHMRIVQKRI